MLGTFDYSQVDGSLARQRGIRRERKKKKKILGL
jgi:hypothetical protein